MPPVRLTRYEKTATVSILTIEHDGEYQILSETPMEDLQYEEGAPDQGLAIAGHSISTPN